MASEMERMRQRSQKAKQRGDWLEVVELLEKYRKALPDDKAAAFDLGDALMKLERFDDACRFYAELLETWPKDHLIASNFGGALVRCGKIQEAKTLLEYSLELNPKNIYARINLGGVYQTLRDYHGALKNSLEAVSIDPTHPLAFNNLGSAFSDLAKFEEAKHAYETAVMLDPKSVDALINLATTEVKLGGGVAAVEMFEKVLTMLPPEAKQRAEAVKFFASFEYLKLGDLKKGWDYYEGGFSPLVPQNGRRTPVRVFDFPRWNFEDLSGKRILIWREQGLGDEILFSCCLPDLIKEFPSAQITYQCEQRLVEIYKETFPSIDVEPYNGEVSTTSKGAFHYHIPLGSLLRRYRSSLATFPGAVPFIRAPERCSAGVRALLAPLGGKKKLIGICWRSGLRSPERNLNYTELLDWNFIPSVSDRYEFFNLQWGDTSEELTSFFQATGTRIHNPQLVDLKNDMPMVFAIVDQLDAIVTVDSSLSAIAGALGKPTVYLTRGSWIFMGQREFPWAPSFSSLITEAGEPVSDLLNRVAEHLDKITYQRIEI